jgi:hypothetical protein
MRSTPIVLLAGLCGCGPRPVPEPPAPAPAQPVTEARPAAAIPPEPRRITICVVENGALRLVRVRYNTASGDTSTMDDLPFSSVHRLTAEYASVAGWYVNNEPIPFRGHRYLKYGLPRVLGINEIERAGEWDGVPIFIEAGDTASVPVLYLPTRPGCEFHPFLPMAIK